MWAGGCLPFSVLLQSLHRVVGCPHVLMVRSRGWAGSFCPKQNSTFRVFPFLGPELPKPDVISQLEQGAELWMVERGIAQGRCPGENPPGVVWWGPETICRSVITAKDQGESWKGKKAGGAKSRGSQAQSSSPSGAESVVIVAAAKKVRFTFTSLHCMR